MVNHPNRSKHVTAVNLYIHNALNTAMIAHYEDRWYILPNTGPDMWAQRREFFPSAPYIKRFQPAPDYLHRGAIVAGSDLPRA